MYECVLKVFIFKIIQQIIESDKRKEKRILEIFFQLQVFDVKTLHNTTLCNKVRYTHLIFL